MVKFTSDSLINSHSMTDIQPNNAFKLTTSKAFRKTKSLPSSHSNQVKLFKNQVAGHFPMFYNQITGSIYKPSPQQEIDFYQKISKLLPQIIPFIPLYKGVEHPSNYNLVCHLYIYKYIAHS